MIVLRSARNAGPKARWVRPWSPRKAPVPPTTSMVGNCSSRVLPTKCRYIMTEAILNIESAVCATPLTHNEQIVMGHGAGGRMSHQLIQKAFLSAFDNPALRAGNDGARLESGFH